jgi:hypothetical protein
LEFVRIIVWTRDLASTRTNKKFFKGYDKMKKIFVLTLAVAAMALAATKTYSVNLLQPAKVGNMELQAGEYRIQVVDETKAIIKNGKMHGETPVKVETVEQKYDNTSVRLGEARRIQEIRIGGTKTKLVFSE